MRNLDVIVPAGGRCDDTLKRIVNVENKALIKFGEHTILKTTINALRSSGRVRRIVLIGSEDIEKSEEARRVDQFLPEGKTGPENIFLGLEWLEKQSDPPSHVMIVTSDLPFLTAEVINKFLDLCPEGADFCVPLVSQADFLDVYPTADATFVKLLDGTWTTGCAYVATAPALRKAVRHINKVFKNRKSKFGMARVLGIGFVYRLLVQKLTVPDVEKKVQDLLQVNGVAVRHSPAQLSYDIDYQDDYYYALNNLASHPRAL